MPGSRPSQLQSCEFGSTPALFAARHGLTQARHDGSAPASRPRVQKPLHTVWAEDCRTQSVSDNSVVRCQRLRSSPRDALIVQTAQGLPIFLQIVNAIRVLVNFSLFEKGIQLES